MAKSRSFYGLLALALTSCGPGSTFQPQSQSGIPKDLNPECLITRVVDGDTVAMACSAPDENVRLIGFDTAETFRPKCEAERQLGLIAKEYLTATLHNATSVQTRFDGRDRYNRPLVELTIDGKKLADIMVEGGYAVAYDGGKRIDWCNKLSGSL
ncbi:MAG: thermonuclease family protein [Pseudoruegeria sp.]